MSLIAILLIQFFISFFLSYLSVYLIKIAAEKKMVFDKPSKRKVHTRNIPTMGGLGIGLAFYISMLASFYFFPHLRLSFLNQFIGLFAASFLILITGLYDDRYDLNAVIKLIIQILAAFILIRYGFEIIIISKLFGGSGKLGVLGIFITILWIVGLINAINLLDGLDGLAAGVCAIAAFFLLIAAIGVKSLPIALICVCFIGALLGFLPHNFYPAKIFMGNTGSMFLGIIMAVISIGGFQKRTTIVTLFIPLLAMALPIIDTSLSIVRRLVQKKPVFKADKQHIHHRIFSVKKSQSKAVLLLYFLTTCFGLISLGFARLQGIYAISALIIVAIVTIRWLKSWGFLDFMR